MSVCAGQPNKVVTECTNLHKDKVDLPLCLLVVLSNISMASSTCKTQENRVVSGKLCVGPGPSTHTHTQSDVVAIRGTGNSFERGQIEKVSFHSSAVSDTVLYRGDKKPSDPAYVCSTPPSSRKPSDPAYVCSTPPSSRKPSDPAYVCSHTSEQQKAF